MDECSEPVLYAKVFASEFFKICKNFMPPVREADTRVNLRKLRCNQDIVNFLVSVKNAVARGKCDEETFKQRVVSNKNAELLHIVIWWYLMKCDIIEFKDIAHIFETEDYWHITEHLSLCLFSTIFRKSNHHSNIMKIIVSDFLSLLIRHKEICDVKSVQSRAYNNFLQLISTTKNVIEMLNTDFLIDALQMTSCNKSRMKLFLFDLVEVLLRGEPLSLDDVMQRNEDFLKNEYPSHHKNFRLVNLLDSNEINSFLMRIFLRSTDIHWENLFYILTSITAFYDDIFQQIKTLNNFLLKEALDNSNQNLLLCVFILVRHCSFPKVPWLPSYLQWFSSTFSVESSRPINTQEKSLFFMSFLSHMVKYDAAYYLKVHINRAPCLPIDCKYLVSDYVKLAKTKLVDLNESAELGFYNNVTSKTSAEFDVETVLNVFSKTNQVPKCVLEGSLFCKVYYEKKFLVKLLSIFEGENSVRHKLVNKLHSLGKLPNFLYHQYQQMVRLQVP